jgi:hypothetical protein
VKGHDGLYYVVQASAARIYVFELQKDKTLLKIDEILTEMGVDNLSIDSNGDIFGYVLLLSTALTPSSQCGELYCHMY